MKRQPWGLFAVALAILIVGLVWAGVPAGTLLTVGLVLVCPLMMFVMMRGMHGDQGHAGHDMHDNPRVPDRGEDLHDVGRR